MHSLQPSTKQPERQRLQQDGDTDRRDRHATQVLLIRMEAAGEVKSVSRGVWSLPDHSKGSNFGDLVTSGSQAPDNGEENGTDESHSKVTDDDACDFAGDFVEGANPLKLNGKGHKSHKVTEVTGPDRSGGWLAEGTTAGAGVRHRRGAGDSGASAGATGRPGLMTSSMRGGGHE